MSGASNPTGILGREGKGELGVSCPLGAEPTKVVLSNPELGIVKILVFKFLIFPWRGEIRGQALLALV